MMIDREKFRLAIAAIAIFFGLVFAYIEYRSQNPEWKTFQEKGISLAIQRLEKELESTDSPDRFKEIKDEIEYLKRKQPQVIEISPFAGKMPPERCLTCHFGIEDLSPSHPNSVFGCVICHGGNGPDLTVRGAHLGLRGGKNPASLEYAAESCGSNKYGIVGCHDQRDHPLLNRVHNVPRSLMATNAGIIGILRFQWGIEDDSVSKFAVKSVADGKKILKEIPPEQDSEGNYSLADSHFRKFCASCHLWSGRPKEEMGRLQGCPACHAPYNEKGRYVGGDPTIKRNESGHASTHTITNRIPNDRCRACHNRSGRVGLNYSGEMESTQSGTPFVRGGLNDQKLQDGRFVWKLLPDIHHEKGMGCIDCHTGQDTMGDGIIYSYMKDQIEIRCEDCHGTYSDPPKLTQMDNNDKLLQSLTRSSAFIKLSENDVIAQTSKGRPLYNVKLTSQGIRLTSKLTGKDHPVSVITRKKGAHSIKGHERLECDSCHSAWSPQCYGCHQMLDLRHKGLDHISGQLTDGRWAEGRNFFRYDRNILGINSRGKVGILVPGCQVWNSVVDKTGKTIAPYDSKVMRLRNGLSSVAVGSIHPHTTRKEAPQCVDCHLDPKAIGLGDGRLTIDLRQKSVHIEPIYDSRASGLKIDFPLDGIIDAGGNILQGTSHKLARGFNLEEVRKITAIAVCLPCHDRYDDPVWQKSGPYELKPACRNFLDQIERK